ncbi:DUF11 domain-containing protein, partial [Dermatophilus congolensis]|nr:DUF11 domain-containing protein [Dermatophilus congolensis]
INLGDTITYTITLTNEGAGTLRNLTITDPMLGLDHAWCQEATTTLAPGASITCTTPTHTVTQRELDLLGATNTAIGHALSGSDDTPALLEATTTDTFTTITPIGKLTVTKHFDQLDDTDNSTTPTPGDLLHYRFVVTNTGNATLRFLTVDDATIQMNSYSCGNIDIAPGASTTCLAPVYTLTSSDITNSTTITNTATATAITYRGDIITGQDTNTTNLATAPRASLTLTKTAQLDHDPNHNHLADPNDTARYTFTATNTGTTTINNLSINDPMLQGAKTAVTCAETALPPAEATTCTTDTPMTINPENITPFITPGNHTLPNTAAAHGTTPPEPTTGKPAIDVFSPSARATIPLVDALIAT